MVGIVPGIYQHYKGPLYLVFGVVKHTESAEALVEYLPLYSYANDGKTRKVVRPLDMFLEEVNRNTGKKATPRTDRYARVPRFQFLTEWER